MSDLHKAAEMALKALEELRFANAPFLDKAMEALRQALAQPSDSVEQELVAFPDAPTTIYLQVCDDMGCEEPFCEHHDVSWCEDKINNSDVKYIRADTAPPKRERSEPREWVGLTDAERKACWHDSLGFYRTIETASKEMERILKEKNS